LDVRDRPSGAARGDAGARVSGRGQRRDRTGRRPWCRKTKQFFAERHIPFEYIDYDFADDATQQRIGRELDAAGASGFPFVRIENHVVEGYRPDRYTELLGLTAAAR
jgi:glutaredoxin